MQDSRRNSIITRVKLASKVGPVTKLMAKITGAPVRGVGNTIGSLVAGRKAAGGIHKGKRLQFAGRKDINVGEYSALKRKAREAGGLPGEVPGVPGVYKVKGPKGQTVYQKDNYRPGGVIGFAMQHPILAGLGGYVGYSALTAPSYPSAPRPSMPAPPVMQQPVNPNPWG